MKLNTAIVLALLGLTLLAACQSPGVISEERADTARSEFEEQKARQLYDEYWQEQMERQDAMEDARERARERQEAARRDDR
jgi:uncharacterized membrane protein